MSYMHLLNESPSRRAGNKVTYQQICNWFVNQRAILRNRQQNNAQQNQLSLNRSASSAIMNNSLTSNISMANNELALLRNSFSSLVNSSGVSSTESLINNSINANEINVAGTTSIPLASIPVDIRSKFNGANGYNPLLDRQSDGEVNFNL